MSRRFERQSAFPGVMAERGRGATFDWGSTVPADGTKGYAPGGLFIDIDAAGGLQLWINEGSATSSAFKVMPSSASGTFATLIATAATITTATITTANVTTLNPTSIVRAGQSYQIGRAGTAKAGTTAGWTVNAGNNLGTIATVAAGQTSSTLVVGIPGLHLGDTITGFTTYASINSGGNTVTLDANLRKIVIAAGATGTDSSIATATQVSVTSATASTQAKTGLTQVVTAGEDYYLLLTATTGAACTIELTQIEVAVTSA